MVNGSEVEADVEPRTTLAELLRSSLGLTGVNVGCEQGICGACNVRVDGRVTRSCIRLAVQCDGSTIETIEGLAGSSTLHDLQRSFTEHRALQCGFCTPGMLVTLVDLLEKEPGSDREAIREAIHGNLCRCTGYAGIVDAACAVAESGTVGGDS